MESRIVLENEANASSLNATEQSLNSIGGGEVSRVGSGASLSSEISKSISNAKSDRVMLVNAASAPRREVLMQLSQSPASSSSIQIIGIESNDAIDGSSLSTDQLVNETSSKQLWPIIAISAPKAFLQSRSSRDFSSAREYMVQMICEAIGEGYSIEQVASSPLSPESASACTLSSSEQARSLAAIINSCNIEELFPNHAWKEHEEESAAASFHSLAATFIRLGDGTSAMQCLAWSDRLEDSPRSLALKALIAREQGETLGAVANMVSSLQQYEQRKKNEDNKHYLTFNPDNLDEINKMLSAGLDALNNRDNDRAYGHFAEAVYKFDPFYSQHGVFQKRN